MPLNNRRRRGFSLIELLIVIAIILIIITVAVPKFQRAQMFARDMGAQKAIQTIHQMEVQYQSQYGRYANSLAELGPPASGAASPAAADLIDSYFGGRRQGRLQIHADRRQRRVRRYRRSGDLRDQWRQNMVLRPDHDHSLQSWAGIGDGQQPRSRIGRREVK